MKARATSCSRIANKQLLGWREATVYMCLSFLMYKMWMVMAVLSFIFLWEQNSIMLLKHLASYVAQIFHGSNMAHKVLLFDLFRLKKSWLSGQLKNQESSPHKWGFRLPEKPNGKEDTIGSHAHSISSPTAWKDSPLLTQTPYISSTLPTVINTHFLAPQKPDSECALSIRWFSRVTQTQLPTLINASFLAFISSQSDFPSPSPCS